MINTDEFWETLLMALVINFLLCGVVLTVTMRVIDKALDGKDNRDEILKQKRLEKARLDTQWREAVDKLLYWVVKVLTGSDDKAKLMDTWKKLNAVEEGYAEHNESIVLLHEDENRR